MSTSGTELPTSILYCRLCQSLYRQPRTLPCLHSFCTDCLRQLAPARDARGQNSLPCPVCGHHCPVPLSGLAGFTPNDFLARMCQEYVGEVQRTITTGRPLSPPPPTSPSSLLAGRPSGGGGGSYFQYTTTSSTTATAATTTSPRSQVQHVSPLASSVSATGAYSHSPAHSQAHPERAVSPPTTVKTRFDYAFRSSRKTSAEQSTTPSTTAPTPAPITTTHSGGYQATSSHVTQSPRQSSSSSSSSDLARRVSVTETMPTRGVSVQRRLSSTPRDVVRTWESLQGKLNSLHAACLRATYSLEAVNLTESSWHRRKQDLRRDIQRRSAQLQFFVKRQERLLLAALDSRGTDDTFLAGADKARGEVRGQLKALMHEVDTLKSVLELATDGELMALSSLLLAATASQAPVSMETPELRFVLPDDLSLEDLVARDFGCLTSTPVTQLIFTPQEVGQGGEGEGERQEEEEEGEDEAFVTDTYTMETPSASSATARKTYTRAALNAGTSATHIPAQPAPTTRPTTATTYGSAAVSTAYSNVRQPSAGVTTTTTTTTTGGDHFENSIKDVAYIDDEEEDDDEEEVVVEETFEIINGKMQVVSKKSFQAPRSQSHSRSSSQSREETTLTTSQRQEAAARPATATTTTTSAGAASSSSFGLKDQSTRGRGLDTRRTVNSALSGSYAAREQASQPPGTQGTGSRTSALTSTTGQASQTERMGTTTTTTTTVLPTRKFGYQPTATTQEVVRESQQRQEQSPLSSPPPSSPPPESSDQQTTLDKFQNIREELAQKRRELLLNTSVYSLPHHPGVAHLLPREKRVHSLDRTTTTLTTTLREGSRRSNSPASPQRRLTPTVAAPVHRTPRHSTDSEDSQHSSQSTHSDTVISRREPGAGLEDAAVTSTILSTTTSSSSGASGERTSRPVRRAISAASDKASKMEYLRETWQRRKELLIQNEAFIPAPQAKPEEDPPEDPPPPDTSEQDPGRGNGGKVLSGADRSTTLKQSLSRKLSNIKQALKKNGKAEEGRLEAKLSDKPPSGKAMEPNTTAPLVTKDVRPPPPTSLTESAAEEKVLKTVESILQKRNVAIPSPATTTTTSPLPLQPSLPDTSPSPSQTSPGGKPSMIVKPRPRDPSPAISTVALGAPALETLEEDVVKVSSPSPKKKTSLRMTSPVRGDVNVEMNQQVRANIRRKKERWRSLSLT